MCSVAVAVRRECQAAEPGRQHDLLLGGRKERALNQQGDYPRTDVSEICIPTRSVASSLLLLFVNMSQFSTRNEVCVCVRQTEKRRQTETENGTPSSL